MSTKRSAMTDRGLRWQLVVLLVRFTPLRSVRARRGMRAAQRAFARWRRERAERMGDDTYSRPAAHDLESRLQRYLPGPGFFVEAGAYDGYVESNTYYFERFCGWTGLLVEPIPDLYRIARKQRSRSRVVNCALVSPEQAGRPVRMRYAGTMSIVEGARGSQHADTAYLDSALLFRHDGYEVQAPGRTLSDVLDEVGAPEVDLLSLDLEGYEAQALAGLDLARHAPRYILVEVQDDERLRAIAERLEGRYRQAERMSTNDVLFARFDQGAALDA
jgi:FkbM family methyltransferase